MTTYVTMGDSTTPASIPATVDRVAGYTTGIWPTYWLLDGLFPGKPKFAFSIAADTWGDALDIERGDATIGQAPGWARNVWRPVNVTRPHLYINAANVQALVDTMGAAGWARDDYVIGSAHYWGPLHICGPATCNQTGGDAEADWTQWASYPGYDLSTIPADLFTGADMDLTPQNLTDIAAAVTLNVRQEFTPGSELFNRVVQSVLQALGESGKLLTTAAQNGAAAAIQANPATVTVAGGDIETAVENGIDATIAKIAAALAAVG